MIDDGVAALDDLTLADLAAADPDTARRAMRARAQTVYLGEGVMLARVLGRQKMLLPTGDRGFACHVAMDGGWQVPLTQFLTRTLQPGMFAVDAGANYGYFTLLLGAAVGATGKVLAIEPNPAAASLLRQTVLLNGIAGRTEVTEAALGPLNVLQGRLFIPDKEPNNARLVEQDPPAGGTIVTVPMVTLDLLTADFPRVDLVKLDAGGAASGIVAGMHQVMRRHRPRLVVGFNVARCDDPRGFLEGLLALYYGKVSLVDGNGTAEPVEPETVLTTQVGENRVLYFEHYGAGD